MSNLYNRGTLWDTSSLSKIRTNTESESRPWEWPNRSIPHPGLSVVRSRRHSFVEQHFFLPPKKEGWRSFGMLAFERVSRRLESREMDLSHSTINHRLICCCLGVSSSCSTTTTTTTTTVVNLPWLCRAPGTPWTPPLLVRSRSATWRWTLFASAYFLAKRTMGLLFSQAYVNNGRSPMEANQGPKLKRQEGKSLIREWRRCLFGQDSHSSGSGGGKKRPRGENEQLFGAMLSNLKWGFCVWKTRSLGPEAWLNVRKRARPNSLCTWTHPSIHSFKSRRR